MRLKRGRSYSSYGSYSSNRGYSRGSRVRWSRIIGILGVVIVIVAVVLWFNLNRVKLLIKGYSFSQQNEILKVDKDGVKEILSHDKLDHISSWLKESDKYKYYDEYEYYLSNHTDTKVKAVVTLIDDVYDNYVPKLTTLNYSDEQIWKVLETASVNDVKYLVEKPYTYSDIEPYMQVKGFVFTDMEKYIEAYKKEKNYNYAVLVTSYPFIVSSNTNEEGKEYTIQNPDDITILVKKGFYLSSDYEPSDLVSPAANQIGVAPDCENSSLRKEALEALNEMYEDAKKVGKELGCESDYTLVINSAYRSYATQKQTYDDYFKKYDPVTAASLVALPGSSEHQTGLGVDLTCQSVLDDKQNGITNSKFSYKPAYKWCVANSWKYGFILRYEGEKADITGIANEEWHFRYVGKEAAKEIFNKGWSLEEYCLYNGVIPTIKEKEE
jgi:D-alanyl-D-alanine carboxypeptidase